MTCGLLLIDAPNLYAKSRFKVGYLTRSDGVPSGGLYGSIRAVQSAVKRFQPMKTMLCFEGGGRGVRELMDSAYKADRDPSRDVFHANHLEELWGWAALAGYESVSAPGCEADDVIAHFAQAYAARGIKVIVLSSDHDFKKLLVDDTVFLCRDSTKGELYTAQDFRDELGIEPEHYLKVCAIAGDASDNLKGVPGFGPKKAIKLLQAHDMDLFKAAMDPKVSEHFDTIVTNHAVMRWIEPTAFVNTTVAGDPEALNEFYRKWEFSSLITEERQ